MRFIKSIFAGRALLDPFWLPFIFMLFATPTGLQLVFVTPIGQVADEPAHIARAAALLHAQIIGERAEGPNYMLSGVHVNTSLIQAAVAELPPQVALSLLENAHVTTGLAVLPLAITARQYSAARSISWSPTTSFDDAPGAVMYFPAFYTPGAAGLAAARLYGCPPISAIRIGRIFMLTAFIALGFAALAVARFGRGFIYMLLVLPITISMAASFNQGALLIAGFALVTGLLTLDPTKQPIRRFLAIPLGSLIACSQPPFAALMFAWLTPIQLSRLPKYLLVISVFAAPVVIWTATMAHFALIPTRLLAYHPGPLWTGDPSITLNSTNALDNLSILLHEPLRFITLPSAYFCRNALTLLIQSIGVLGWLHIYLLGTVYLGWIVAMLFALFSIMAGSARLGLRWRPLDALFILLLQLVTAIGISLSMYLAWTRVGAAMIDGVQGRYFLLLAPFLVLALPRFGGTAGAQSQFNAARLEMLLTFPAIAMSAADLTYLPKLMLSFFPIS